MASVRENIKALLEERANVWETTGKPLADIAVQREFTAEETETFERASAAFDSFGLRIRSLELTLAQERAVAEFVDVLRNDDEVRSAFETELRTLLLGSERVHEVTFNGREVNRALSVGTPAAGGNVVPKTYLTQLLVSLRNFASVLDAGATIITTGGGEEIVLPRLSTPGAAAVQTELVQLTGTDPTFDQVSLKAYKFGDFRGISRELVEDSIVDIEAIVTMLIGQNIGVLLGQKLATGTGIGQTQGISVGATVGVTGATGVAGVANFDNMIDLFYSVGAPYRARGAWLIADLALAGLRKLKGNDGQYLWAPSVQVGQPDLILGKPVYGDAYLDAPAVAKVSAVFGDFSGYWVRIVNGLRIERSDQALFGTDQIAFKGVLRADGALVDPSAVKSFKGAAT